ncbi:MAG: tRNA preQ1(34) S-adenosylmethionine ribosyltransferase-isomerase QueA [Acidimicrobiales bacterium]|nr:tRNA preQ1(34) S-adenosylmethionine ribosyltransferase-isomerase QueA [Acidimicrobiales bacterium]
MAEFDYGLPEAAVAQVPAEPRDAARLLVDLGPGEAPADHTVADLATLLHPGDLLVVNDTRVLPGRLRLRRASGGAAEVLLLERRDDGTWEALARPDRRLRDGERLRPAAPATGPSLEVEVGEALGGGRRVVRLCGPGDELAALAAHGEVPLPPYIHTALADQERYQTVYAERPASAAAPTAGLHLTPRVLAACARRGVGLARVELVVGLDTFRPVTVDDPAEHRIHTERFRVPPEVLDACGRATRVVAVGTTTVRALETAARGATEGRTDLFIRGDFPFAAVDVLLTNFHQPRSSLLLLVAAFVGPRWRELYDTALARGYRFLSFGDAMLLERR